MADSVDRSTADDVAQTGESELQNPASPTIEVCSSVIVFVRGVNNQAIISKANTTDQSSNSGEDHIFLPFEYVSLTSILVINKKNARKAYFV